MVISDTLDSIGGAASTTTTTTDDSDLNFSLHMRPGATALRATSDSNATELDNSTNVDGGAVQGPMESANFATRNVENRGGHDIPFTYRPSVPAHRKIKESPLSSDAIFKQYGWLIKTGFWFSSKTLSDWPLLMCCLTLPVFPFAAFIVEKLAQQKCISEPVVVFLHVIISTAAILYPVFVILGCDSAFVSGVTLMLFACIVWLKLVSYAHTNSDMRSLTKSVDKGYAMSGSPNVDNTYDVSFKSLAYFMVAPTLCYQPIFPRTAYIRKGWVVRQFVKLIIFTGVMGFIIEQYINPIMLNSQHPLKGNFLYAIERVLKLSVPNLYVWLCMFYCFFHLWLNILAELLCFGDREFYKDWWNAKTVEEYWRKWNMPVHKWLVRHIYFPCLRHGIPKLCIAVPCHIFKLWAFICIMFQAVD